MKGFMNILFPACLKPLLEIPVYFFVCPRYIPAMPQAVQEEIREKLAAKLTGQEENAAKRIEQFMRCQIYDLKGLIDIKEYVAWADKEIYRK